MPPRKPRVPVPEAIAAEVQLASDRTCCVCQKPGRRYQIHHIDNNPANNDIGNLAVLCYECHDLTQIRGGFARGLDAAQIVLYRDDWVARVAARRAEAGQLIASANVAPPEPELEPEFHFPDVPPRTGLLEYVQTLPQIRRLAYVGARPGWDTGVTAVLDKLEHRFSPQIVQDGTGSPPSHLLLLQDAGNNVRSDVAYGSLG